MVPGKITVVLLATICSIHVVVASGGDREALADVLGKRFQQDYCVNFEAALLAMGVPSHMTAYVQQLTSVIQLTEDKGDYTLRIEMRMKGTPADTFNAVQNMRFRIGEQSEILLFGISVTIVVVQDGNTLIQKTIGQPVTIIRTFTPEEVKFVNKIGDVTSTCIFKPVY